MGGVTWHEGDDRYQGESRMEMGFDEANLQWVGVGVRAMFGLFQGYFRAILGRF